MIIGIQGLPRSGKTIFLTSLGYEDYLLKIPVVSNYWCSFTKFVNPNDILDLEIMDSTILLTEVWSLSDSSYSVSGNRLFSYFGFQAGKNNNNIYYDGQILKIVGDRLLNITNLLVECEKTIYDKNDNSKNIFNYYIHYPRSNNILLYYPMNMGLFIDFYGKMYNHKELVFSAEMVGKSKNVTFQYILDCFENSGSKDSFIELIRSDNPYIPIGKLGAVYTLLKKENFNGAKKILRFKV